MAAWQNSCGSLEEAQACKAGKAQVHEVTEHGLGDLCKQRWQPADAPAAPGGAPALAVGTEQFKDRTWRKERCQPDGTKAKAGQGVAPNGESAPANSKSKLGWARQRR